MFGNTHMQNTNLFVFSPFLFLFLSPISELHMFCASPGPLKANTNNKQLHIKLETYLPVDGHFSLCKKSGLHPLSSQQNTILDKHGKPQFGRGILVQPELPWHCEFAFGDPNWQQARRSPKQSHHLRRHRRPGETVLVLVRSKSEVMSKVMAGWIWWGTFPETTSNLWAIVDGKLLCILGMTSLQGPSLHHRRQFHVGGLLFNIPKQCNKQCNTLRFTVNPLDRKQSRSTNSTLFLAALGWCSEWIM